jgi:organic radical activating enzyme
MASFSFVLTEVCDWKCPYCYFTNIKQKEPNLNTIKKHIFYIKKIIDELGDLVVNIDIQGGEVGTIPLEILEYFFQTIKKPITISTNGMFIEKGYHENEKIKPYINSIFFHYYDFYTDNTIKNYILKDIPVLRGIVHNNVDEIVSFIKKNNDVIFDYIEFEFDIEKSNKVNFLMYHDLLNKIIGLDNISNNAMNIIYSRLSEKEDHRDNCKNYNHSILIDMVNEAICLCQRQLDVNIPLTEKNLIHRLKTFPKHIFEKSNCESCTRLYAGKFNGNVIERALLTRNLLKRNYI